MLLRFMIAIMMFAGGTAHAGSLYFHGGMSANDADRVKVRIDDPATREPGPPADIGDDDFTIDMWIRTDAGNDQAAVECKDYDFVWGNIILDRDRYEQGRAFGISLTDGRITFSVQTADYLSSTVCGNSDLRDGAWHHVAVQRRYSDGRLWVFVDGRQEAAGYGPRGDISYPDAGSCKAPDICTNSDHYLVFGAEKHDLAAGFSGWLAEVRLSNTLRYSRPELPDKPFESDKHTVALYRFDEGSGDVIGDSSAQADSPGKLAYGTGSSGARGPVWSTESPFAPH